MTLNYHEEKIFNSIFMIIIHLNKNSIQVTMKIYKQKKCLYILLRLVKYEAEDSDMSQK